MKALLAAFGLFATLLVALSIFWTLVLAIAMEDVWDRLPDGASEWLGGGLLAFAVASGLALYLFLLAKVLDDLGVPPGRVKVHLVTTALVPPLAALAGAWLVVANLRLGW